METENPVTAWINGNIITMNSGAPRVSAIVVRNGIIEYAGNDAEALRRAGATTSRTSGTIPPRGVSVRDLHGRTAIPGFNDNHVHAVFMADNTLVPDLTGLGSREIVELLKERYPVPAPSDVIRAFNWDYPSCPEPRKEILDDAFPRNPVILTQYSGHAQWLNTLALRDAGIRKDSPDPATGTILRDTDREPTGIVRDLTDPPLARKRNRDSFFKREVHEKRIDIALATFARLGITSIQDNAWYYPEVTGLARRHERGELTARVTAWSLAREPGQRRLMDAAFAFGFGIPDWVRKGPVKYFLDGTFSTRNACLFEPFIDGPGLNQPFADPLPPVKELTFLALRQRQGAFHIIGDKGVAIFLDAYDDVLHKLPDIRGLRIRIEHAQLIKPRDIERIARLGVLVAAQPTALGAPEKDAQILGRERALRAYPYRSLIDAGVNLSFGSDIPGESECDPMLAIHLAVNREGPERITVEEAIRCYTSGSAYAEFMEKRKGTLAPGMLADFAILSKDITAIPPEKIRDTIVEETVVGGKSVYKRTD